MFDEKNQEQVVEETLEASEIQNVEKASADDASTTTADNVAEIADYLNPELFNDVKTLSDSDLDENSISTEVSDEIEKKYLFPSLVNGAIYSFDVGCRKPNKKIYDILLKKSKSKPNECVFIDDLSENVHAAQLLGIKGIHYRGQSNLIMDFQRIGIIIQ